MQLDPLRQGRSGGEARPRRGVSRRGHRAVVQPWLHGTNRDERVEGGGIGHDALKGAAVDDRVVAVGEVCGAGFVHQPDLGHAFARAAPGQSSGRKDPDEIEGRPAPVDEVHHCRIVDRRVDVGLDDDGRDASGRGREARRLQRLLGLGAGLAGLDAHVDQSGRQAQPFGLDDLDAGGRGAAGGHVDDAAVLDQQGARRVQARRRVQQAGVDDGEGGHRPPP
jgi:hypothetical protein